jgi:hypothetical protein
LSEVLESDAALDGFLEAFERGTWPKSHWTHAAHVTVAASYLLKYQLEEATDRIRRNIRHYNECAGTVNSDHVGYHEIWSSGWRS